MKKKIFGAAVVVAIAVGAMINVNLNKVSNKGDLALANVEALAQSENDPNVCYNCRMVDYKNNQNQIYKSCCESSQGSQCSYKQQVNC